MTQLSFRPKTSEIPTQPGVYRFLDKRGRVLYVGKAKNLKSRLTSYFGTFSKLHERTQRMLLAASDVKWTIVDTEYDALQLEFMWIKEFDPPYNVRFRDDKSYPYLAISVSEDVPRAFITRNREIRGLRYFGPYTQAWAIRETLDTLLKVYPVRSCSKGVYDRAVRSGRPCLLAEIGKCSAPCVDRISKPEHKALAKRLGDFVASGSEHHVAELREKMQQASDAENFELAANLRDDVAALEKVLEKTTVVLSDQTDADLIGLARDELSAAVSIFIVRGGRIRGNRSMVVDLELDRNNSELIEYLIQELYTPNAKGTSMEIPKLLLVPELPKDKTPVEAFLSGQRGKPVKVATAQRGEKATLAKTAQTNAEHALNSYKLKRSSDFTARADALAGIQRALQMEEAPLRIECFDISHLSGTGTVGSMVVFEDGLPKKDQYRRFNLETADDTESIYQVLMRRLKYLGEETSEKFSYRPSLMLIDGGLPQRGAAIRALEDSGIGDITIATLAKRLEEVFTTGSDYPVIFPRTSEELFLLQRIRDEAHRFAITAQRAKRSKTIASQLLEIPGLGERKVRLLLRKYGSLKRIRSASAEEIATLDGFGLKLATQIREYLGDLQEGNTRDTPKD
ncbi:MAG: excinuclease ABC subunit C [Candidatus Aquiluna sp. XM-24bin5]|nr:MAG: excinuclease ABC subunit C [Candidatus Aquiluna sp. XM-24bin5]